MGVISSTVGLLLILLYGSSIALLNQIFISMFTPVIWLLFLMRHAFFAVLKRLFLLNTFVVIIVATLLLQEQFDLALLVFVRSNCIILFVLLLFHNKNEFDIAFAMQKLKLPDSLVSMVFFTAKFIFLIKREFAIFKKTLHVRGFVAKTNLFTYQTLAGFVGLLVIKAFKRAQSLQQTMLLRQFQGKIYALEEKHALRHHDIILSIVTLVSIILHQGAFL